MPIDDEFEIAVRAYAVPVPKPQREEKKQQADSRWRRTVPPVPPSAWTVTFDTEFRVDAAQQLTVGTYQVREAGELREAGCFYDPESLSDEERATLFGYARAHDLLVREVREFVEAVFFRVLLDLDGTCIGFNLPLDLSQLAIHHDVAHSASMRGGFTFQLSTDPYRPWLQVRHLNSTEAFIRFAAPARQRTPRGMRKRKLVVPVSRGHFVDVHTLACALMEHKGDLRTLAEFLEVPTQKGTVETYEGPISAAFLDYAVADVEVTWECYAELAGRYAALGLPTPLDHIYSAASIGKAHLDAMGVRPWRDVQHDMPPELLGAILAAYYGGRSEVHLRRVVRQVRYCDFLSMYPTVCTHMGLWRFVTATGMTWSDTTAATQAFLDGVTLDALQRPATWRDLTTIVELVPDDDLLPVRAKYDGTSYTIGLNYLSTDAAPVWYPLADLTTAKLNGERVPRIRRAITFAPKRRQAKLRPIELMGNHAYSVDPAREDAFRRIIELRSAVKAEKKVAKHAGDTSLADRRDAEQHALKIIANAMSYGIFIELNVSEEASPVDVTCYGGAGAFVPTEPQRTVETPGRYFHPLLATLITAAARLMLGIAERVTRDAGLDWAFTDTDSWALAKPDGMDERTFTAKADAIQAWFDALNPYRINDPLFKTEDANFAVGADGNPTERPAPLYCFAVSAKRYVLFNLDAAGRPVIRKASAHGLGHLRPPYEKDHAPASIPAPAIKLGDIGVARWQYDLWYRILEAALAGHPAQVALSLPGFDAPAVSRYAATTPELLHWFDHHNQGRPYREQVRPFGFLLAFQARGATSTSTIAADPAALARRRRAVETADAPAVVAPYDRDPLVAAGRAFDRRTGKAVEPGRLATYPQVLAQYHLHPEAKFHHAAYLDAGPTERRHVRPRGPIGHIGKEANRWEEQFHLGANPEAQITYGATADELALYRQVVAERASRFRVRAIADRAGVSIGTVSAVRHGLGNPSRETLAAIDRAVGALDRDLEVIA
jgi:hypothetical protein